MTFIVLLFNTSLLTSFLCYQIFDICLHNRVDEWINETLQMLGIEKNKFLDVAACVFCFLACLVHMHTRRVACLFQCILNGDNSSESKQVRA